MKNNSKPQYQYILFDLDETLYPKEAGLMDVIGERISLYMAQTVGIPADDVAIKRRYLAFIHNVNPRDFFGPSPPLNHMLEEVPLRKVVFTNADAAHCERVLDTLQVRPHFEMIIDIRAIDFKSKPDPWAYKRALQILNVPGESCIMVDDKPRNLIPAKDLGMTTILVDGDSGSIAIDYTVPTIFHVENVLRKLLPMGRY
jgi:putative hydrolase of the HAD superfamily